MRRVRYHAHGGPEVLTIEEADIPRPGPGQVLIRAEAIGLNYVDVQLRRETSPDSLYFRPLPATLTGDVVGTIQEAGPDTDPALVGTRVAALSEDAYAEYVVVDADWLVNVPPRLDAGTASVLSLAGPVALGALRMGRLQPDDIVLVTAAAGTIGHLAVQLAKHKGARTVIATAGSPAKVAFLKELGADVAIDHTEPDWAAQVRQAAPDGVDLALDAVGGEMLHTSIGLLAPFGRAVAFGASAGDLTSVPITSLFALKTLTGFSLMAWRAADSEQARADIAEMTALVQADALRVVTETKLPLNEVVQAHRLMEQRTVLGRLLLIP
ncbi:zinc-binding alcohol dehydrogenase family protein [Actinomadura sp. 6N118]|uniref:zinc-binding alcohol dehydrogenase family protein n=1 Tax=Actinomadura sp. 6N118 TaxID=3375151 RepID=UPI00378C8BE4